MCPRAFPVLLLYPPSCHRHPLSLSLPVPSLGQRSLANLAWYSCPPGTDAHWGLGLALTVPPQGSVSHTEHCHSFTTDRTHGNTTKRGLTVPAGR